MYIYPHKRNVGALTSKGRCDYQGSSCVSNASLRGCKNCAGQLLLLLLLLWVNTCVRQQFIDYSIIKYRDLLENVISCSPGQNR